MKKRLLAALMAGALCVTALTGCGGGSGNASGGGSNAGGSTADGVITINYPTFQCGVNTAAPVTAQLVKEFNETYAGKYQIVLEEIGKVCIMV